jgi:activator of 2-hydroxyglutaryl-CoA dehydratase
VEGRHNVGDLGVDEGTTLKQVLMEHNVRIWTEFN